MNNDTHALEGWSASGSTTMGYESKVDININHGNMCKKLCSMLGAELALDKY
jgi:hypothetical protein